MKEADYKRRLVADINAVGGAYARRIEDRFAVGVLDLMFKLPALPWTFAEAKLVNGHLFAPSERQFVEGERIMRTGTPVILIGWKSGQMYLSSWVKQGDVRTSYSDPERSEVNALREYLTWRQQERLDVKEE